MLLVPNVLSGAANSNSFLYNRHHNSKSLLILTLESIVGDGVGAGVRRTKPLTFGIKVPSVCMNRQLKSFALGFSSPFLFLFLLNFSIYSALLSTNLCMWEGYTDRTQYKQDT